MEANIHSFESLAALDGDGLRYAVYFCGCPLQCVYCHNPDTQFGAGTPYTPAQVAGKIKRCKPYIKHGGATFSGGEPLLHAAFINETAALLAKDHINYCLDTAGSLPLDDEICRCLTGAALVILDLKFYDDAGYMRYTAHGIEETLETARFCNENNIPLWFRTVIVPGINDSEAAILNYAKLAHRFSFKKYELLPFHTMGFYKYEELQIENPLKGTPPMDRERLQNLQNLLNQTLDSL